MHSLIATAGLFVAGILETIPLDKIIEVNNIQIYGTLRCMQAFAPLMRKAKKPRLILSSSPTAVLAMPCMGVNVLSRHATEGLAKIMYVEGGAWPNPLQVCNIWPCGVKSSSSDGSEAQVDAMMKRISNEKESGVTSPESWSNDLITNWKKWFGD